MFKKIMKNVFIIIMFVLVLIKPSTVGAMSSSVGLTYTNESEVNKGSKDDGMIKKPIIKEKFIRLPQTDEISNNKRLYIGSVLILSSVICLLGRKEAR